MKPYQSYAFTHRDPDQFRQSSAQTISVSSVSFLLNISII
jgi:hypothetical protein